MHKPFETPPLQPALPVAVSPAATNTDAYLWTGAHGTDWGKVSNWIDTTTGANPPASAPTATNPVTIGTPNDGVTELTGVGASASISLEGSTMLAGRFTSGDLILGNAAQALTITAGDSLTLSGSATIADAWSVSVSGAASSFSVAGTLALGSSMGGWFNTGTLALTGGADASAAVLNDASGAIRIDATSALQAGIGAQAAAGSFTVLNGVTATAGGAITAPEVKLAGTLDATNLALATDTLIGSGTIAISGSLGLAPDTANATAASASLTIAFGADSILGLGPSALNPASTFKPQLTGFAGGDAIDWYGNVTRAVDSSGTLTLYDQHATVATLALAGDFTGQSFVAVALEYGGTEIAAVGAGDTATAPAGTTHPDTYEWTGGLSGSWDNAANWRDDHTGRGPTAVAPGANNTIDIGQTAIDPFEAGYIAISGAGNAAGLNITGAALLDGQFTAGTLSTTGTLSIAAGATLAVTGAASIGTFATLAANGAAAALNISGTLTTGTASQSSFADLAASNGGTIQLGGLQALSFTAITVDATSAVQIGAPGNAAAGNFTLERGAAATANGIIAAPAITLNGVLQGNVDVAPGNLNGNGVIQIENGGSLTFGYGTSQIFGGGNVEIAFAGTAGTLALSTNSVDAAGYVTPEVEGFGAGNVIAWNGPLTGITYQTSTGNLGLLDGPYPAAQVKLAGTYTNETFALSTDVHGTSYITLAPAAHDQAPAIAAPPTLAATTKATAMLPGLSITGSASDTFTVVIRDAVGSLSANTAATGGGGTVTGSGSNEVTISGLLSQVNADLSTFGFQSAIVGQDSIVLSANDGQGGVADQAIAVTVTDAASAARDLIPRAAAAPATEYGPPPAAGLTLPSDGFARPEFDQHWVIPHPG